MEKNTTALAIFKKDADEHDVKKALYNLTVNAETKISDKVNSIINVVGFAFTQADVTNKESGELETRERVVVIDADGKTYHSVASGIVNSFRKIADIFGDNYNGFVKVDPALAVKIVRKDTPKGNTFICTLE